MLRLYLLGGEDLESKDSKEIDHMAFRDAGGNPLVVVFPWTSKAKGRQDVQRRMMVDYFKELGARGVRFVEPTLPYTEMVKLVEDSDLIYLPGGDPKLLVELMRNTGAAHLLRTYDKVIIGNSAGAVAMAQEYVLLAEEGFSTFTVSSGLGLLDFSVAVHYEPSMDAQLESLSTSRDILAIPEGSALFFSDCSISLLGEVEIFKEGKKA
jgi:dipeptidase E